jgi:hypothetical protein
MVGETPGSDDPVRLYLSEIGRVRLLTARQEVALAEAIRAGEHEAARAIAWMALRMALLRLTAPASREAASLYSLWGPLLAVEDGTLRLVILRFVQMLCGASLTAAPSSLDTIVLEALHGDDPEQGVVTLLVRVAEADPKLQEFLHGLAVLAGIPVSRIDSALALLRGQLQIVDQKQPRQAENQGAAPARRSR